DAEVCMEWNVARRYRAAHRPQGNSIVERVYRTMKSLGKSSPKTTFWYNLAARDASRDRTSLEVNEM
ncbi:hypothetical protein SK128_014269, partial [Halocaridina rubra]